MSITVEASGTQSAVTATSYTLSQPTTAGVYQFITDLNELAGSDVIELRVEMKVLTAGTKRVLFSATYGGAQSEPIKMSPPVSVPFGADFILNNISSGATRSIPWSVLKLS